MERGGDSEGKWKDSDPPLRHLEELVVLQRLRQHAHAQCQDLLQEFADCSKRHPISLLWSCRRENRVMNRCMLLFVENEELLHYFKMDYSRIVKEKEAQRAATSNPASAAAQTPS